MPLRSSPSPKKKTRSDTENFTQMKASWNVKKLFGLDSKRHLTRPVSLPHIGYTTLLVDSRERCKEEIKECMDSFGVSCEIKRLEFGDYMWVGDGYSLNCSIERKTVDDLSSSIKDGRFEKQNSNMKKYKMKNLFYLVEGTNPKASELEMIKKEGFGIIRTRDKNDTFEFLLNTTMALNKHIKSGKWKDLFFLLDNDNDGRPGPFVNYSEMRGSPEKQSKRPRVY